MMRLLYFDPYLQCCEQKMKRSVKKYYKEQDLNEIKKCEIQKLKEKLKELQIRLQKLHKKMANYRKLEDFLQNITPMLPTIYLESEVDSLVDNLRQRHQTLLFTNQILMENMSSLQQNLEKTQHEFEMLQTEHETAKIDLLRRISQLQGKSHTLHKTNELVEDQVNCDASSLRYRKQNLNEMLYGISNMAEQCYMRHYGPLEEMPLLTKLDMIQEFILEKLDIKQETT